MKIRRLRSWLLIIILVGLSLYQVAAAQSNNLTGLIIDTGNGEPARYCLDISGENPTGYDLLTLTGQPVAANHTAQGAAVCKIGSVGCPVDDCFCDSPPNYWSYWHLLDGQWIYAASGASSYQVEPGSVDAWIWGDGSPPEITTLEQICIDPEAIHWPTSINTGQFQPVIAATSSNPTNYLVFGILASILGAGLIWMVFRR